MTLINLSCQIYDCVIDTVQVPTIPSQSSVHHSLAVLVLKIFNLQQKHAPNLDGRHIPRHLSRRTLLGRLLICKEMNLLGFRCDTNYNDPFTHECPLLLYLNAKSFPSPTLMSARVFLDKRRFDLTSLNGLSSTKRSNDSEQQRQCHHSHNATSFHKMHRATWLIASAHTTNQHPSRR